MQGLRQTIRFGIVVIVLKACQVCYADEGMRRPQDRDIVSGEDDHRKGARRRFAPANIVVASYARGINGSGHHDRPESMK